MPEPLDRTSAPARLVVSAPQVSTPFAPPGAASRGAETAAAAPAPRSVLIEAAGHTCVGWWHAPASLAPRAARPLAVVLASSWGDEDIAGYDAQRALGIALARDGLGTLRFEWPDTGDSSAATGASTIADALAAFDAAARQALALSGHERLAFVGWRLGALLAAHAAAARADVDALVALQPVADGRAFVRAQSARPAAWAASPEPGVLVDPAELPVAVGGFALSARRLEALSALRWPTAATTPVLEALLVDTPTDGAAAGERLARTRSAASRSAIAGGRSAAPRCAGTSLPGTVSAAGRAVTLSLARMGARVRERVCEAPLGADARAGVVGWLRERAADASVLRGVAAVEGFGVADPANGRIHARLAAARLEAATAAVLALAAADAPVWMRLQQHGVAVRERVVRIDDGRGPALAAVLAERDPADAPQLHRQPRRGIVLLSSDGQRRIGPQRLWVHWARHRAARGDVLLRLDTAGAGDSAAGDDPRAVDDIARALAWLRRETGVVGCTVVGFGSGARHAWRAAVEGLAAERVIAIEPAAAPAPGSRAGRALRAATRLLQAPRVPVREASGAAIELVLAGESQRAALAQRRLSRLVREGRARVCEVARAQPDFASPSDRAALCARLDALVQAGAAAGEPAARAGVAERRADGRSSPAAEARRAIGRASEAAS